MDFCDPYVQASPASGQPQAKPKMKSTGRRQVARIFISSTFRDMHGERDHLTRVVFPELQERCKKYHVKVTNPPSLGINTHLSLASSG
jgi:hypothetical protein